MSNAIAVQDPKFAAIENVLINGDLSRLNPEQRVQYVQSLCASLGLNPVSKPFDYITLQGRLTLYAKKDAAEQLRKIHGVSIKITGRQHDKESGIYIVTAHASMLNGREDESTGVIAVPNNMSAPDLANLIMKCETKAKRRVTLSICGLGILDESEVADIPERDLLPQVYPEQPAIGDGHEDDAPVDYVIPGGTYVKRKFKEIDAKELGDYVTRREEFLKKNPQKKPDWWDDFVTRAEGYLGDLENGFDDEPGSQG